MKKKIILLVAVVTLLCGCGKTIPKLENGQEAIVTFKSGDKISVDEVYSKLKDQYATSLLIDMIDKKILEDKYKDDLKEAEDYANNNIESLKTYYVDEDGNYDEASLLSAIQQYYGYSTMDEFKDNIQLSYLRNKAIEDYTESTIKDSEIQEYYDKEIVGDREILHIQIIPEVTDTMSDAEKTDAEEKALKEAKALIARLKKGEKFEDLAKEASDDEATKEKGGSLGTINKGDFGSDQFDKEAFSLKVKTYSKTPVKTNTGYEIIYVKSEKEKAELKDVKESIIETLRDQFIESDATLQVTGLTELRKEYGVDIVDTEVNSKYDTYVENLMSNARATNEQNN